MKLNCKWALVLLPLFFAGCEDKIEQPTPSIAYEGDDVRFSVDNSPNSRTMYQDDWDETTSQAIYWGNYVTTNAEFINIYCPDNPERGFARYKVTAQPNSSVAETIVKTSEIGVQWGASGKPYTFYAFYPADRASTTLENGNTIRATVGTGQSPTVYKYRESASDAASSLTDLDSFKKYNSDNYTGTTASGSPKIIYGMPDMNSAVMVARKTMPADKFGLDVPLQFNVLADVLDITLNGPVTPNTLGGNANSANPDGIPAQFIQIQALTIEVVDPDAKDENGQTITDISKLPVDNSVAISGSFDLNMAEGADKVVDNVSGNATIQLQTSMTIDENGVSSVYYPTLFVRGTSTAYKDIDHLRLRAFLIPGQVTGNDLRKLRVHLQTNCGDFYQMLENDGNFVTGNIYPVKFGYFKTRGVDFDLKAWVSQLDPDIYLSELSVPGAWHAANPAAQGGRSIQELYDAGIRAFEVHTINGTQPYVDNEFSTELTSSNVSSQTFEDRMFNLSTQTPSTVVSGNNDDITSNGLGNLDVTAINMTVTQTETRTYSQCPKFYLRLFRTSNISSEDDPEASYSDALISAANNMKPSGFMFLEFGHDNGGYTRGVNVPCKTVTETRTRQKTGISLTGRRPSGVSATVANVNWDIDKVFTDADAWSDWTQSSVTYDGTVSFTNKQCWSIAVESCLNRLRSKKNEATGRSTVLYTGEITANTTIRDIQGYLIAKINTNNDAEGDSDNLGDNENTANNTMIGWSGDTPAIFSRWIAGSGDEPMTINMKWGAPVAPYSTPETALRWCFTELDNVGATADNRKKAIDAVNDEIAKNYANPGHNTYYEVSLGGYLNGSAIADNYKALSKELNGYVLNKITNPTRNPVPVGFVFMNYAIPPTGEESTYNSTALIRAIINNNKAFLLRRAGEDTPAQLSKVEDKTNSNFTNTTQNPLK